MNSARMNIKYFSLIFHQFELKFEEKKSVILKQYEAIYKKVQDKFTILLMGQNYTNVYSLNNE